jgi:site-specific DNA-methyltransferase (adenine-specific)
VEIGDFSAARGWLAAGCPAVLRPGYVLNQIATGDARELAASIPDGSVDLVFTDPVYQNIEDYTWLAETAMRVLKPRGVLLAWTSVPKLGKAQQAMEDAGAQYVYTLFYTVVAKTHRMRWYNLFCWTTPCLWFQRPGEATKPRRWMPDTYQETMLIPRWRWLARMLQRTLRGNTVISQSAPTGGFGWNKNTGVLVKWIEAFCPPGGVVFDPFTGTGSLPCAAKTIGRHFLAGEIVPERADEARQRLAATPSPLIFESPDFGSVPLPFDKHVA